MISPMVKSHIRHQFARRLVQLRHKHKLTQEQLAERSGVSDKYIQMLESKNPRKVSIEVMEKLAHGFGIPPWKLLKFK